MKIKTLLLSLFFALGILTYSPAHAQSKSTKYKTSSSKSYKKKSTATRPKTVRVKSYTKKNGTRVAAHKRAAPRRK